MEFGHVRYQHHVRGLDEVLVPVEADEGTAIVRGDLHAVQRCYGFAFGVNAIQRDFGDSDQARVGVGGERMSRPV